MSIQKSKAICGIHKIQLKSLWPDSEPECEKCFLEFYDCQVAIQQVEEEYENMPCDEFGIIQTFH